MYFPPPQFFFLSTGFVIKGLKNRNEDIDTQMSTQSGGQPNQSWSLLNHINTSDCHKNCSKT